MASFNPDSRAGVLQCFPLAVFLFFGIHDSICTVVGSFPPLLLVLSGVNLLNLKEGLGFKIVYSRITKRLR